MKDKHTEIFKALADPTRRKILQKIQGSSMNVGDLVKAFKMSQPAISNHLKVLRHAELVVPMRCGKQIKYQLNKKSLKKVHKEYFHKFRGISR